MSRDALIVGINDYHYMQPLKSPSADAEAVAAILEQYGEFSVKRLPEAIDQETNKICIGQKIPLSLDELEKALVQLFKPTGSSIPDTALFFFSGHGLRRDLGIQEGFLCTSETGAGSGVRGLSLQWLRRLILESDVRQQIIMLDCCYSGELFNLTEADPGHLGRGRDRCFIAASREFELAYEETAGDHGVFTRALLDGLDPKRPLDGMVNNTELSDFIAKQLTGTVQKPIFSNSGGAIILTRAVRPMQVPKKSKGAVCPYRGLSYFDCNEEDPQYFYGRAALTDQLLEKVRKSNFVAVLGPSGSGKSSVVRAGLLHQLKVGRKLSDSDTWPVHIFRPGEHPLKSLAMAFVNPSLSNIDMADQLDKAEDLIVKGAVGLDRLIRTALTSEPSSRKSSGGGRVVLVADQFEEVFSLCRDENERDEFLECLLGVLSLSPKSVCLILNMRADFLAKCAEREYSGLSALIQTNMVTVTPMTTEEFEQAIVKPAEKVGIAVEPELIKTMVEDVKHSPGSLPLLQYTLTELWNRGEGEKFTLTEYTSMGGVKGSLARRADEVYQKELASDQERAVAKRIFIQLTQLGEGTEDTRRQILKQSLVKSPEEEQTVAKVIQTLADAKLIVTGEIHAKDAEKTRDAVVDVAHEALIRHWPRLRGWLDENREDIRFHRRLAEQARHWDERGKPEGLLWRPPDLHLLRQFYSRASEDMTATEITFFKESEAIEEGRQAIARRRVRNTKIAAVFMLVLALIGGIASIIAIQQKNFARQQTVKAKEQTDFAIINQKKAEKAEAKATEQQKLAIARQLAAEARLGLTDKSGKTLVRNGLLAVESIRHAQTVQGFLILSQIRDLLPQGAIRLPHKSWVKALAFNPNGTQLASADWAAKKVRIWDAITGDMLVSLQHDDKVENVVFSQKGKHLVSLSAKTALIWDTANWQELNRVEHEHRVTAVTFSSNGAYWATGSGSANSAGEARVLHPITGEELARLHHESWVTDVIFSVPGQRMATKTYRGKVRIWETHSWSEYPQPSYEGYVAEIAFSGDGKHLATASRDGTARVWDVVAAKEVSRLSHRVQNHPYEQVSSVAFSGGGAKLATAGWDGTARIWDLGTGKELIQFNRRYRLGSVSFIQRNKRIITLDAWNTPEVEHGKGYSAILWDVESGRQLIQLPHEDDVLSMAINHDDSLIATGAKNFTATVWKLRNSLELYQMINDGEFKDLVISLDGTYAVSVNTENAIQLWNAETGKKLSQLMGPNEEKVTSFPALTFSRNGAFIAFASSSSVRIWDTATWEQTAELNPRDRVLGIIFSPDGKQVLIACYDKSNFPLNNKGALWDTLSGAKLWDFGSVFQFSSVKFNHSGSRIATIRREPDQTYILMLWDAASGQKIAGEHSTIGSSFVGFSQDGARVAALDGNKVPLILDSTSGKELTQLLHSGPVNSISISSDGSWLAAACTDKTARLWNMASGEEVFRLSHDSEVTRAYFSPDATRIATTSKDNTVIVWNSTNGHRISQFSHSDIGLIVFSSDGIYLVSVGKKDKTARIWNTDTGVEIGRFSHNGGVIEVAFSANDRWLITKALRTRGDPPNMGFPMRVWSWRQEDLIDEICSRLPRHSLTSDEWRQSLIQEKYRPTCGDLATNQG